jgi:hypothetical protein
VKTQQQQESLHDIDNHLVKLGQAIDVQWRPITKRAGETEFTFGINLSQIFGLFRWEQPSLGHADGEQAGADGLASLMLSLSM